jgi:5'-nucleotidase
MFKRMLAVTLAALLLTTPVLAAPGGKPAHKERVDFWLTILHNNDGESRLLNAGSGLEDFGSVARLKVVVDELKRSALTGPPPAAQRGAKRGVLMLSSGDNFLPGPEFNVSIAGGVPFLDTIALDAIGYDAIVIGNHDFDFGPDTLADFISGFSRPVPYLSANLDFSAEPRLQAYVDAGRIAGSVVIKVRGERIGIVGATTPALPFISSPRRVVVSEVAPAVQAEIDALEARGINKIIVVSHLQSVAEDFALAGALRGVDIMIAGGGDELLANPGDLLIPGDEPAGPYPLWATGADAAAIPVVTTSGNYKYVGRLAAGFDRSGRLVRIDEAGSGPVRVAGGEQPDAVAPDPYLQAVVIEPVIAGLESLAANTIGTSEVPLDGRRTRVRTAESNQGNLIADALLWQARQLAPAFGVPAPDVALQNGGGIRNDAVIPAGDITELDTFAMLPFANFTSVIAGIGREQFKELLENAVSRVEFGDGRFAQVAGFSFAWDPAGTGQVLDAAGQVVTPGTRVRSATLADGTVLIADGAVVPGGALNIASIDFLARGGDQYPYRGAPFTALGVTYQQALRNYIEQGLGGSIPAAEYPEGGSGRINRQ